MICLDVDRNSLTDLEIHGIIYLGTGVIGAGLLVNNQGETKWPRLDLK